MLKENFSLLSLEDSDFDYEIIHEKLLNAGYSFTMARAKNKPEFTTLLSRNSFDLIISDFNLQDINGFEALRIVRDKCPEVPFLCVSGYIGEDIAIELLKQGAVDYVLKDRLDRLPFAFNRALEEAMEKKSRKLAEEALLQSEARLSDIIFSMADWVWEVDENGAYTYSSRQGMELLDKTRDQIIGKTPFDFMPEEEALRVKVIFAELLNRRAPIKDLENWNIGKNGKRICLLTNGVPIIDKQGNFKGYRGVDVDITERKLAEEALLKSEASLNYAQKVARMGSWHFDLEFNSFSWSKNMFELLGIREEAQDLTYESFISLVHPDDVALIDQYTQLILETKNAVEFDFRYLLQDGRIIWVQNNIIPLFREGRLVQLDGTNIDITDKKLVEQELVKSKEKAEASDKLKSAFINNISHEVRTPLNGIIGFSEMLLNPEITESQKMQFNAIIRKSSSRLMRTITSYMDISLIVSGNMDVYIRQFSLPLLLEEVYEEYLDACHEKDVALHYQPDEIPELRLQTDSELIRKVFSYLLDNAIKFTLKGEIRFGYRYLNRQVECFVKDTGCGIEKEKMQLIFDNFMQADISMTRGYEGSGLGLSIVNGLVKLLNGRLKVNSELGLGTEIIFTLPEEVILRAPATVEKPPVSREIPSQPLILVAEDDDFNYEFIDIVLKDAGFRIERAMNGAEAVLACTRNSEISLVLMDMKMPVMSGAEAAVQIRTFLPQLPIIAVTAYVSAKDEQEAMAAGCNDFMPKPIRPKPLLEKIQSLWSLTL